MTLVLNNPGRPAIVVFSNRTDLVWLKLLKPGFRHCFAILRTENGWLTIEALSTGTVIAALPDYPRADLMAFYREAGHRCAVVMCGERPARALPWSPFTCVESVKRLIGLSAPRVRTPFQLWKHIFNI